MSCLQLKFKYLIKAKLNSLVNCKNKDQSPRSIHTILMKTLDIKWMILKMKIMFRTEFLMLTDRHTTHSQTQQLTHLATTRQSVIILKDRCIIWHTKTCAKVHKKCLMPSNLTKTGIISQTVSRKTQVLQALLLLACSNKGIKVGRVLACEFLAFLTVKGKIEIIWHLASNSVTKLEASPNKITETIKIPAYQLQSLGKANFPRLSVTKMVLNLRNRTQS